VEHPMKIEMNSKDISFSDLLATESKMTFLVGAGCSTDPPSCLPSGKKMMEAIIKYICAESEIQRILKIKNFRFEQLVEIFRDLIDPDLKIIDYYGQCDRPNLQHFFLAEMIKNGHFVMTTNFDFLIERALQNLGVLDDDIIPVITKHDFEKYNPYELTIKGKKAIYKLHGSTQNIITGEKTKDSLIATIQAFGLNKKGLNIFQVQPYQREAIVELTKDHTLIIMGYSGSDDFDIIPTLKILKNLKNIIWINHINIQSEKETIFEVKKNELEDYKGNRKVDQILREIKAMGNSEKVYRVDVNTTELIKKIYKPSFNLNHQKFNLNPINWLRTKIHIKSLDHIIQHQFPFKIYSDLDMNNDAMRCAKRMLKIAQEKGDKFWISNALNMIGIIFIAQGNYPQALIQCESAIRIEEELEDISKMALSFNNIGLIYSLQGNYIKALDYYYKALKISRYMKDLSGITKITNNIGAIYKSQCNYPEAIKRYEEALKIIETMGDLSGKAVILNNIGEVFRIQCNYPEAIKRYEEALEITGKLGDLSGKAGILNNLGEIFRAQGKYSNALKKYEKALEIAEDIGDLSGKILFLNNIGLIYKSRGNFNKALKLYNEALKINKNLGESSANSNSLNNVGLIYYIQEDFPKALEIYKEVLRTDEELGNFLGKATSLNNIGLVYNSQGDHPKALEFYKKALKISEQLSDLSGKARTLCNIGSIYHAQENYPKALDKFVRALKIYKELGILSGKAAALNNIGEVLKIQGNFPEALKRLGEAMGIIEEVDDILGKAKLLHSIAEILRAQENYPEVIKQYFEALTIFNKIGLGETANAKIIKKAIDDLKSISH